MLELEAPATCLEKIFLKMKVKVYSPLQRHLAAWWHQPQFVDILLLDTEQMMLLDLLHADAGERDLLDTSRASDASDENSENGSSCVCIDLLIVPHTRTDLTVPCDMVAAAEV